ncbi:sialidase-3-like isoform X1 [Amphiura filiformis]|uniref:sialidase-3-like isoform X1 n=1 Tax=Amphiura filiformis TaxID=82378 RepID=UPI003B22519C
MRSRVLPAILSCGVLALIWLASHMRTPVSRVYDDPSGKVSDDVRARGFKPATPVETEAEVLFSQDMNGYNTTRIPALVYHHDMFFAFAEGRRLTFEDIGEMDIIMRRGRRKDWKVAWGPVEVIARQSGYRMMNPVPIVDTVVDMILLVYNAHPSDVSEFSELVDEKFTTKLMSIKSYDLGVTWTKPQDMNHETIQLIKPRPSLYAPGPGHGIQMKSGRLIVPGNFFSAVTDSKQIEFTNGTFNQANVIYSDDHGNTWHPGGSLGYREHTDGRAIFSNEATAVELDNKLCLNARTLHPDQPRVLSFSNDKGASFGTPKLEWSLEEPGYYINYTGFWNNFTNTLQGPFLFEDNITTPKSVGGCQASMIGFTAPQPLSPSNTWVVFSNPASFKTRRNMAVKISKDGCRTWSKPWVIHANASAYSDLTYFETWDSDAGVYSPNIAILYEAGKEFYYESIQFKMFSLERMLQGIAESSPFSSGSNFLRGPKPKVLQHY